MNTNGNGNGTSITVILSHGQARALTDEVKADAASLWSKLVTLYEGEAHTALGYTSWGDYFEAEFGQAKSQAYRILDAGRVARALSDSPIGEWGQPTESQARELAPLLDHPDALRDAWRGAHETAARNGQPMTAAFVRESVRDHFRGEAAASVAEIDSASANMPSAMRAALSPELCRQRGEFKRLIRDLASLCDGNPNRFANVHRGYIEDYAVEDASRALVWLEDFLNAWQE